MTHETFRAAWLDAIRALMQFDVREDLIDLGTMAGSTRWASASACPQLAHIRTKKTC